MAPPAVMENWARTRSRLPETLQWTEEGDVEIAAVTVAIRWFTRPGPNPRNQINWKEVERIIFQRLHHFEVRQHIAAVNLNTQHSTSPEGPYFSGNSQQHRRECGGEKAAVKEEDPKAAPDLATVSNDQSSQFGLEYPRASLPPYSPEASFSRLEDKGLIANQFKINLVQFFHGLGVGTFALIQLDLV
ncbi:hypothetical protein N657DRAFT_697845 [Parathielavia appendiculata]|uniref:Uncharacterized protein n=1 Tax=Parathielavia appendiculata TaxID=2587402 RepID=A0AAN6UB45_9PEZI|nr:hypothetical protein N657DRAFT_697845 [Parathielavia appendiculata]